MSRATLTVAEVADRLGLHHETVRRMLRAGTISAFKVGSGRTRSPYRVLECDLDRWISQNRPDLDPTEPDALNGAVMWPAGDYHGLNAVCSCCKRPYRWVPLTEHPRPGTLVYFPARHAGLGRVMDPRDRRLSAFGPDALIVRFYSDLSTASLRFDELLGLHPDDPHQRDEGETFDLPPLSDDATVYRWHRS